MPTVNLNGFQHYYDDEGAGEAIVMLHGAMGSAHNFERHVPILSQSLRVIVPDMRGMGRSEHVGELSSPSAWLEDLIALMDHLGLADAHIFGNSLGSRVGMRLAIDTPARARSLILQSPHIYLTPGLDAAQNQAGGDGTTLPPERQADLQRRHGEDWLDVVRNYFSIRNAPGLQEFYDLKAPLTEITCPVLAISADSRGHTLDHALELHERLRRTRLAVIPAFSAPGATGAPQIPAEMVCDLVLNFVGSLTPVQAAG